MGKPSIPKEYTCDDTTLIFGVDKISQRIRPYDLEVDAPATCEELASDCVAPEAGEATSSDGRYHRGDASPRDSSMA